MNLDNLITEAKGLIESVKSGTATPEQVARLDAVQTEIRSAQAAKASAEAGEDLLSQLAVSAKSTTRGDLEAKSLGEHLVAELEGKSYTGAGFQHTTSEYKANTDVLSLGTTLGTTQDAGVAPAGLYFPTIAGLFPQGATDAASISYLVEAPIEGDFAGVAEGTAKPQLFMNYTEEEDKLGKIAGFIKETTEFAKDRSALASAVNGRLLKRLQQKEEAQLINGSGTNGNVRGLLTRSGLLSVTSNAEAENLDRIYEAVSTVEAVTGYRVDGIVVNPADYRVLRLAKNANGDYFAGGPFEGGEPGLWGRPTVVSAAVPAGTVIVGAFGTAGMVWRNGGVSLDVATQHADDFTNNLVTVRAEERVGLAVYMPSAFATVTLSNV